MIVKNIPVQLNIRLIPYGNNEISFQIYSISENTKSETIIHSQGSVVSKSNSGISEINLQDIKSKCNLQQLDTEDCYSIFAKMGVVFGPAHRGIVSVYAGIEMALAKLSLPSCFYGKENRFILHPSMLDSSLQSTIGLMLVKTINSDPKEGSSSSPLLPFALDELEIIHPTSNEMWAVIQLMNSTNKKSNIQKINIDLCDENGVVAIRVKGYSARSVKKNDETQPSDYPLTSNKPDLLVLTPSWEKYKNISTNSSVPDKRIVINLGSLSKEESNFKDLIEYSRYLSLPSDIGTISDRFQENAIKLFLEIKSILSERTQERVLIQVVIEQKDENQLYAGLWGMLQTAQLENPRIKGQLFEMNTLLPVSEIAELLNDFSLNHESLRIKFEEEKKQVLVWNEIPVYKTNVEIPWHDHGVYLITGGMGGLGYIFAEEIARKVKSPVIILTGRSLLDETKQLQIENLTRMGASVHYLSVDVADPTQVNQLINEIYFKYGSLKGILHTAGVIHDNFIIKKDVDEIKQVLSPKVDGLINLDEATKEIPMDFFILFSSGTGAFGNAGQADYAAANAFMDSYAAFRNDLAAQRKRYGQTLSHKLASMERWRDENKYRY